MRALIVAVILIVLLVVVGWLQFSSPDGDPTLRVDSDKIKADTSSMVDQAKEAIDEVDRRVDVDVDTSANPDR